MTLIKDIALEGAALTTLYDTKSGSYDIEVINSWEGAGVQVPPFPHAGAYALKFLFFSGILWEDAYNGLSLGSAVPNLWIETFFRQRDAASSSGVSCWIKSGSWKMYQLASDVKFHIGDTVGTHEYTWNSWVKLTINATATRFRLWIDDILDIDTAIANTPDATLHYGTSIPQGGSSGARYWLDDYLKVADAPFDTLGVAFRLRVS